jgi:hypothetical protein
MPHASDDERRLDPEAVTTPNRDRRGDPTIIEGDVTDTGDAASSEHAEEAHKAASSEENELFPERPEAAPHRSSQFFPLAAAGVGAAVGALVVAGVLWLERPQTDSAAEDRVAALDKSVSDLSRRLDGVEASLKGSKSAMDAAKAAQADSAAASAEAAKAMDLAAKTAASIVEERKASPSATPNSDDTALSARLDKIENSLATGGDASGGFAALEARLGKLEAALQAPKSETRVAPESAGDGRKDSTALAVAAEVVATRLASGAPYAGLLGGLERLGADPTKIAAMKPFAEHGAPTSTALAASFRKIAPEVVKAGAQKATGGVMDRLVGNMSKIVKISPVGEIAGDDAAALVSQIEGALDHGDIGAAMTAWARLPEPARQASQDWANGAQERLAAEAAAQGILNDAMAKLAANDKP